MASARAHSFWCSALDPNSNHPLGSIRLSKQAHGSTNMGWPPWQMHLVSQGHHCQGGQHGHWMGAGRLLLLTSIPS